MLTVPVALSCSREEDIVKAGMVSRTKGYIKKKMGKIGKEKYEEGRIDVKEEMPE